MSKSNGVNGNHYPPEPEPPEPLAEVELEQWLEALRNADRSLYNLLGLEVWSMAKTMDSVAPGFWNRFMRNRQVGMQKLLRQRQARRSRRKR